jgi:maleylacetoacetate isomerase
VEGLTLYTYFRSSCSYRVRIAMALKGLPYSSEYIHLIEDGGRNWSQEYLAMNPQGLVPMLKDGAILLTQSLAIIEYLDHTCPQPPLLPSRVQERAYVRSLAQMISSDIQPLNNLQVLEYLRQRLQVPESAVLEWYRHWTALGFRALEQRLSAYGCSGDFCHGEAPTLADICLVPQVYNARRYECELDSYPLVMGIYENCMGLSAFQDAAPGNQGDAQDQGPGGGVG